ncbi:MAG: ribonuclease HII [Dehalococcoidales bacterium]|jgi:ribonuclease HII
MNPKRLKLKPSFAEERRFLAEGYKLTAGVDEVGRGCLAGPVVACAVILPCNIRRPWLKEVRDSKLLTHDKREYLFNYIEETSIAVGTGVVAHDIIDTIGIGNASKLAMQLAIEELNPSPDSLLIDYFKLPEVKLPQKGIIDGDGLCYSIACASIIAKVTRDLLMVELDGQYPGYGLSHHKGYGTKEHWRCIEEKGLSPIHRLSFCHLKERFTSEDED